MVCKSRGIAFAQCRHASIRLHPLVPQQPGAAGRNPCHRLQHHTARADVQPADGAVRCRSHQDRAPGPWRRDAFVRAEVRRRQCQLRAAEPGQALAGAGPQERGGPRPGDRAGALGRRGDRAVPSRRDGAAGPGLRGAARRQPTPHLLLHHGLGPGRTAGRHGGARPELPGRSRPSGPDGRLRRSSRPAQRAGGRPRRRRLPGHDEHHAGPARTRCGRAGAPPGHCHGRQPVHLPVLGPGQGLCQGPLAYARWRPRDGRHAALPSLPHAGWRSRRWSGSSGRTS